MKKLKFGFVFVLGLIGIQLTQAQTSVKEKPTIIVSENKEPTIIKHKSITYYVIDGFWHTKLKNKYVLKSAPKGAIVTELPLGGENVKLAGKAYYKCKGVFYKKLKYKKGYEVARP